MEKPRKYQNRTSKIKSVIYVTLFAFFLCFLYWPTLRWLVNSWLSSDYYSHGFLVPLVSASIIWTKREHLQRTKASLLGIAWLVPAVGFYTLYLMLDLRVTGPLSLLSLLVGLIWLYCGPQSVKALTFPLAFLLFMVPFPFVLDIAYSLQVISIRSSTWILSWLGFPITSAGGQIYLGNLIFSVGLPCSGISSLIALLATGAVYAYILKGHILKRTGLFVVAIPFAILVNIFRIVSIILVAYYYNMETASGWFHDLASPLFFLLAFMLLVLTGGIFGLKLSYGFQQKTN